MAVDEIRERPAHRKLCSIILHSNALNGLILRSSGIRCSEGFLCSLGAVQPQMESDNDATPSLWPIGQRISMECHWRWWKFFLPSGGNVTPSCADGAHEVLDYTTDFGGFAKGVVTRMCRDIQYRYLGLPPGFAPDLEPSQGFSEGHQGHNAAYASIPRLSQNLFKRSSS